MKINRPINRSNQKGGRSVPQTMGIGPMKTTPEVREVLWSLPTERSSRVRCPLFVRCGYLLSRPNQRNMQMNPAMISSPPIIDLGPSPWKTGKITITEASQFPIMEPVMKQMNPNIRNLCSSIDRIPIPSSPSRILDLFPDGIIAQFI